MRALAQIKSFFHNLLSEFVNLLLFLLEQNYFGSNETFQKAKSVQIPAIEVFA